MGVGVFACIGHGWPPYAAAALAAIWLIFLASTQLMVSSVDEPQRFQAMLIIRLFLATPTIILLPAAACGIATDRAIRRRQAELDRRSASD